MSGVASPPPASSAPSAARADDLFALVKFVQSDEAHARLAELRDTEQRATEQRAAADAVTTSAKLAVTALKTQIAQHDAAVSTFRAEQAGHYEQHARRNAEIQAREASVLEREDRCTRREREHDLVLAASDAEETQRETRLAQRERELDARIQAHEAERAGFERRRSAVDQAMRS
jgi:hypothetical protein